MDKLLQQCEHGFWVVFGREVACLGQFEDWCVGKPGWRIMASGRWDWRLSWQPRRPEWLRSCPLTALTLALRWRTNSAPRMYSVETSIGSPTGSRGHRGRVQSASDTTAVPEIIAAAADSLRPTATLGLVGAGRRELVLHPVALSFGKTIRGIVKATQCR